MLLTKKWLSLKLTPFGLVLSFLMLPLAAHAQLGLYADFSTAQSNLPNANRVYGSTFGAYYDKGILPLVNLGVDARGSILGENTSDELDSGLAGPRVAVHLPLVPINPYVEGLVGMGHADMGEGFGHFAGNFFEYAVVGGADLTIFPRVDWRVIDFTWGRLPNLDGGTSESVFSTGIVLRLPAL